MRLMILFSKALLWAAYLSVSHLAVAQEYPVRPIKLIVGFSPGGAADSVGRALAEGLSLRLGQTVVVENRAGANGNLAAEATARSPADGYALYFPSVGHAVNVSLYKRLSYDPIKDFTPIGKVFTAPNLLVVTSKSPFRSPEFDSLKAKWLIFMGLTSKRSITDWCSCRLRWVF